MAGENRASHVALFLRGAHTKKPPLKGEVPAKRAEGFRSPAPQGRGGSVSRRDHNPKTRKHAHIAWACNSKGKRKPIPSYSSGEGVWGRGASLREAASPPESPCSPLSRIFPLLFSP